MSKAQRSDGTKQKALLIVFVEYPKLFKDSDALEMIQDKNLMSCDLDSLEKILDGFKKRILTSALIIPEQQNKIDLIEKWIKVRHEQSALKRTHKAPTPFDVDEIHSLLGVKKKVSTYSAKLENSDHGDDLGQAFLRISIKFGNDTYALTTSDAEALLNILNPIVCDENGTAIYKDEIRRNIKKVISEYSYWDMKLNPSIYQKLYGSNSPGKLVFQKLI